MASFWEPITRLFGRKDGQVRNSLELFREIYGGRTSKSGIVINAQRALEISVVLACVRVLAEGVAQVPFRLYREQDGKRKPATDHPLYRLISRAPNENQSSFEFRETLMMHLVLTGNAFVFLNRVGTRREIREMVIIEPGRVEVKRNADWSMTYKVRGEGGTTETFPSEAIWHLRGPSWNSWLGMDAVKLAREALGLAVALEESQSDLHRNGAQPSGLLSVEGALSPEKYKFLAEWLDKYAPGGERAMKAMLLDMGAKFTPFRMTGVDSQHLESRKFQAEEACRPFRVLPIMIGLSGDKNATFASAEQMFLAHVTHTMMPWFVRIEMSGENTLLSDQDRKDGLYLKLVAAGLLRGASKERSEYFAKALGSGGSKGWMTQNEVRGLEELDRSDDPEADKLPQPPAQPQPSNSPDDPEPVA
jgi:HK97 family phage portal protein